MGIMSLDEAIKYAKEHEYEPSVIEYLLNYRKYLNIRIQELNDEKRKCEIDLVLMNLQQNQYYSDTY